MTRVNPRAKVEKVGGDAAEWDFWWILSSCMEISCPVAQQLDASCMCSSFLVLLDLYLMFFPLYLFLVLLLILLAVFVIVAIGIVTVVELAIFPVVAVVAFVSALSALSASVPRPP